MGSAMMKMSGKTKQAATPPASPYKSAASAKEESAATQIQARARGRGAKQQVDSIKALFEKTDKNSDGKVTKREIIQTLGKHDEDDELRTKLGLPNPKLGGRKAVWAFKTALDKAFADMDKDADKVLTVAEFSAFLEKFKSETREENQAQEAATVKIQAISRGKKDRAAVEEKKAAAAVEQKKAAVEEPAEKEVAKTAEVEAEKALETPAKPPAESPAPCCCSEKTAEPAAAKQGATETGRTSPSSVADPTAAA